MRQLRVVWAAVFRRDFDAGHNAWEYHEERLAPTFLSATIRIIVKLMSINEFI